MNKRKRPKKEHDMKAALWGSLAGLAIVLLVVLPVSLYLKHPERFQVTPSILSLPAADDEEVAAPDPAPTYPTQDLIWNTMQANGYLCLSPIRRAWHANDALAASACDLNEDVSVSVIMYLGPRAVGNAQHRFMQKLNTANSTSTQPVAELSGYNWRILVGGVNQEVVKNTTEGIREFLGGTATYPGW